MLNRREECYTYLTRSMSIAEESHSVSWKLYILSFHRVLSALAMSTGVSQVGVTLLPSTFPGFPFVLLGYKSFPFPECEIRKHFSHLSCSHVYVEALLLYVIAH